MKHYYLFKLRAVLLLFAFLCSMPNVWADESGSYDDCDITWSYVSATQTLTISGTGDMLDLGQQPWELYYFDIKHVVIESGVTSIGSQAFHWNQNLLSVSIPSTVTKIGFHAFDGCTSLTSITLPDNLVEIGNAAFLGCINLSTINMPPHLQRIGSEAFFNCNISTLTIPDGVTTIGYHAFMICPLTNVMIPASVTSIGVNPFMSCDDLISITVDSENTKYDSRNNCNAIIEKSTKTLVSGCRTTIIPRGIITIGADAFEWMSLRESLTIPNGVKYIQENAFHGAYANTQASLVLPQSVVSLGRDAFENCNLADVYCYSDPNNFTWESNASDFDRGESDPTKFHVTNKSAWEAKFPDANVIFVEDLPVRQYSYISGDSGPMWMYDDTSKELVISGNGEIQPFEATDDTPWNNVDIEAITIEDGVTSIGDYSFKNTNAQSVVISNTVETIGAHAFESCTSLASIEIPEGVEAINAYAFQNCSALETIILPSTLTSIETGVFQNCAAADNVYCDATPTALTWRDNETCFKGSKGTLFHVADKAAWAVAYADANVTYVQDVVNDWTTKQYISGNSGPKWRYSATLNTLEISGTGDIPDFTSSTYPWNSYTENIYTILIKDGVTSIGSKAFQTCYYTQSFIIGNDVTSIGRESIPASEIASIFIPQNVSNISIKAFDNTQLLSTITVDSRNTYYDSRNDCNAIITKDNVLILGSKNTIIPDDVVAIGDYAFYGSSIERCVIPNNVTTIGEYAFAWSHLYSIVINGAETIKTSAFMLCSSLSVITLPSNLTRIENYVFERCDVAKEIYCFANSGNLTWEGYNVGYCFKSMSKNNTPNFHVINAADWEEKFPNANANWIGDIEGEWTAYKYISGASGAMWKYCPTLKTLQIGGTGDMPELNDNINDVPWFNLRAEIENIIINDGVTCIGKHSFSNCERLTSVIIPNSVTSINYYAFQYCRKLNNVIIPSSVNSIGNLAFNGCYALTTITLPSSVTSIGERVFHGCISLSSAIIYASSLPTYATDVFLNNATNRKIYVLSDCVNTYKAGWNSYANDILPISLNLNPNPQVTMDKWCTYYNSSTNVTVPPGTTIYKAQLDQVNNKVMLTEVEGSVVAKGNAVMLKSSDANIALSSATTSDLGTYSDNDLKGGDVTSGYIAYTLAGINGIMGFYRFTGNSLDPNKAHLEVANSNPNSAPQLIPFDNGTTEIMLNTVKTAEDKGEWYSLDGRQIQGKPTQKGIYVKKGKKYVVK